MIRSWIFQWKGYGERTKIGRFRKADRTVAKLADALILRERTFLTGSGSWRHNRQSRPGKNETGLRRGCGRKLGQTSDRRRSQKPNGQENRQASERSSRPGPLTLKMESVQTEVFSGEGKAVTSERSRYGEIAAARLEVLILWPAKTAAGELKG